MSGNRRKKIRKSFYKSMENDEVDTLLRGRRASINTCKRRIEDNIKLKSVSKMNEQNLTEEYEKTVTDIRRIIEQLQNMLKQEVAFKVSKKIRWRNVRDPETGKIYRVNDFESLDRLDRKDGDQFLSELYKCEEKRDEQGYKEPTFFDKLLGRTESRDAVKRIRKVHVRWLTVDKLRAKAETGNEEDKKSISKAFDKAYFFIAKQLQEDGIDVKEEDKRILLEMMLNEIFGDELGFRLECFKKHTLYLEEFLRLMFIGSSFIAMDKAVESFLGKSYRFTDEPLALKF